MKIKKNHLLIFILIVCINKTSASLNSPKKKDVKITLSGELDSKNSEYISTPANWNLAYQIVYLPKEGNWVEKGDTVVIFDKKEIEKRLDEVSQQAEQSQKRYDETLLKNYQTMQDIITQKESLEIQKQINESRLEQSKYNSETGQQYAVLELKKVNLNIKKTDQSIKSQKIMNKNSENELLLQIEQSQKRIKEYKQMLTDMTILAPKAGIIVYHKSHRSGKKIKIGDSIRPLSAVLQIPDLNNMIVKIGLNEVDLSKIKIGQKAAIEVLAYPDTIFQGTVNTIARIAEENENSNIRVYPVTLKIDGQKNFRLKPGLTVKVDLILENIKDTFSIPSWCLFKNEDIFFVKTKSNDIPVELIKIYDGKAYLKGNLDSDIILIENNQIPNY